ncbi:hypothetical protein BVRB_4g071460 [Beta vulgaris subsp. vulgaris]|nr:hypothetical protein BVRB_4g071460 [Beta vulgaris subsp. vulgaris]
MKSFFIPKQFKHQLDIIFFDVNKRLITLMQKRFGACSAIAFQLAFSVLT